MISMMVDTVPNNLKPSSFKEAIASLLTVMLTMTVIAMMGMNRGIPSELLTVWGMSIGAWFETNRKP